MIVRPEYAGVDGIEPSLLVLETNVLPLNDTPLSYSFKINRIYDIILYMRSVLEFEHIGYDSQRIKPDLGEYRKIPAVQAWLNKDAKDRFPIGKVIETVNFTIDSFDETNMTPADQNRYNMCVGILNELAENERKSPVFKVLECLKEDALLNIFQNERSRATVRKDGFKPESLDEMVTLQVIGFWFDYIERKQNEAESDKNDLYRKMKFSAN